jgi:glycosyltransferase involved in cell wall biosynthesis
VVNVKFSIITPEHTKKNIPFLLELYDSILNQTYSNWEWIIYLNNDCTEEDLPSQIRWNEKVTVYRDDADKTEVGYFKNKAFHLGTGDILVEADHDDILIENCLEELYKVYQEKADVGFVYSNNATYKMNGEFMPYSDTHGWKYEEFKWRDKTLLAMKAFPPTPQSIAYIWYAPDHVRSWRASLYREIGGHDVDLDICDDQELLHRTYIATTMHHIDKVLYVYRITGDNTWLERSDSIQETTRNMFDKNIRSVVEKEANTLGLKKIDIGGGLNPYGDYETVDIRETADYVADLNDGIPLPDNSVYVLNAHHILEHLKDPIKSMREIHRVLCHGGWAFIEVPSTEGKGAFQDPTPITFWNDNSFLYYTDKNMAEFIDNSDIRFQEFKKTNYYPNQRMRELDVLVTCAVLVAVKEGPRLPGALFI